MLNSLPYVCSTSVGSWRGLAETIALIVGIQGVFFLISFLSNTELLFDLSASLTFIAAFWYSRARGMSEQQRQHRHTIPCNAFRKVLWLTAFGTIWAVRLGGFLFWRILKTGGDARFDRFKGGSIAMFAVPWLFQIAWVSIVGMPIYLVNLDIKSAYEKRVCRSKFITCTDVAGYLISAVGLLVETVADIQKWLNGRNGFPNTGLFRFVRYPQYAGEIAVWSGVALSSWSMIGSGFVQRALSMASPIATFILLRFVSGVPLAEQKRIDKFGSSYLEHRKKTPLFFP